MVPVGALSVGFPCWALGLTFHSEISIAEWSRSGCSDRSGGRRRRWTMRQPAQPAQAVPGRLPRARSGPSPARAQRRRRLRLRGARSRHVWSFGYAAASSTLLPIRRCGPWAAASGSERAAGVHGQGQQPIWAVIRTDPPWPIRRCRSTSANTHPMAGDLTTAPKGKALSQGPRSSYTDEPPITCAKQPVLG